MIETKRGTMKTSVLIVSYNTKDLLKKCLASLHSQFSDSPQFEVIVVDNASSDDTVGMLHEAFPWVTVIANQENCGFGKANNQAYAQATGEYIFLLNPDTTVEGGAIKILVDFLTAHPKAGLVAPRLLFPDGTIQPSCFALPTLLGAFAQYFLNKKDAYDKYYPLSNEPKLVEAVVGAAMLLNRPTIQKLGKLFDEKFYFYYEDIDLCRRIGEMGLQIFYLPQAKVFHYHGAATSQRGSWSYEQNQRSAKIYFGALQYFLVTQILKYGQKWQKVRSLHKTK